jgi:hypothetical protein
MLLRLKSFRKSFTDDDEEKVGVMAEKDFRDMGTQ